MSDATPHATPHGTPDATPDAAAPLRPVPHLAVVGATVLTASSPDACTFIGPATIEVVGDRITAIVAESPSTARARLGATAPVGTATDSSAHAGTTEVIDATGLVAMPGFVNTHCHAAMTLLRGAAEDVTVKAWFDDYIWPMEVNLEPSDVYLGTLAAAAEMIEAGVTTFADHYFFMDEAARAVVDSGIRADLGSAFFTSQGDAGLEQSVDFATRWHGAADGRITTSIAPHAPYTVSDHHLSRAADAARTLGVRVHTHAAEDMHQTEVSLETRGITPIEVLQRTGVLDAGVIIAHGNGITPADIDLLAPHAHRAGVTHGPKGYLKFALGPLTPIRALLAAGVPVGYCTDGAASNNTLDIAENMRIASLSQKQVEGDPTWFTNPLALHLAGPSSAAVIGRRGDLGEVSVGALADLALVDVSGFHCQPLHDLTAVLVHCIRGSDVRTTIVGGRVLMRDRQLLTIDRAAVLAEMRSRAATMTDRSHGRRIQDYTT
jgi:5-methylthioadenosine/S-adenosylhomocysteine deaminase